jgi:predicted dehydrogenase
MPGEMSVAVVGAGYWGPNLIRTFAGMPGWRLAWICDRDPRRLAAMLERYPGIRGTTMLEDVLGDATLQVVAIATPAATHYALARQCLLAGKHVLVEKPFVLDPAQGEELIALAAERKLVLMVDHIFLYNPAFALLCTTVHEGQLGSIRYVNAMRTSLGPRLCEDANIIWDAQIHDVYMATALFGTLPARVAATGGAYCRPGVEDVVFSTLFFPGGAVAHLHNTSYAPLKERRWTVVGSEQMAVYDDMKEDARLLICKRGFSPYDGVDNAGNRGLRLFDDGAVRPEIAWTSPLELECAHLQECVRTGQQPRSGAAGALGVLRVLLALDRSLKAGGQPMAV